MGKEASWTVKIEILNDINFHNIELSVILWRVLMCPYL